MRVVMRVLSIASTVSGRPGPVPGAGGNCADAGCAERNASAAPKNVGPTALKKRRFTQPPLLSFFHKHSCERPLSHFTSPDKKCERTERDLSDSPFSGGTRLPEKPCPAEHGKHGGHGVKPHFEWQPRRSPTAPQQYHSDSLADELDEQAHRQDSFDGRLELQGHAEKKGKTAE